MYGCTPYIGIRTLAFLNFPPTLCSIYLRHSCSIYEKNPDQSSYRIDSSKNAMKGHRCLKYPSVRRCGGRSPPSRLTVIPICGIFNRSNLTINGQCDSIPEETQSSTGEVLKPKVDERFIDSKLDEDPVILELQLITHDRPRQRVPILVLRARTIPHVTRAAAAQCHPQNRQNDNQRSVSAQKVRALESRRHAITE